MSFYGHAGQGTLHRHSGAGRNPEFIHFDWIPAPAYYMPGQAQSAGMTERRKTGWKCP